LSCKRYSMVNFLGDRCHAFSDAVIAGAYFVVFAVSVCLLVRRQQSQGGQKIFLTVSVISFCLATLTYANRTYLASTKYVEVFFRPLHDDTCATPGILTLFGLTFNVVCGDTLLVRELIRSSRTALNNRLFPTALSHVHRMEPQATPACPTLSSFGSFDRCVPLYHELSMQC
jgi:hypothetical protein